MQTLTAIVTALACLLGSPAQSHSQDWGVVQTSTMLHRTHYVAPVMPQVAIDNRIEGFVYVEFTIAIDGTVKDLAVVQAQPIAIFDEAALAAVSQWRYQPRIRKGEPVEQHAMQRLNFNLPQT